MLNMEIKIKNFLAISYAELITKNNIVILIAPNRAGKTQILQFLYGIFFCIWKMKKENKKITKENFEKELKNKLLNIFLLKKTDDFNNWNIAKNNKFQIEFISDYLKFQISGQQFKLDNFFIDDNFTLEKNPIFIQPAGMGDYYKGIYSLKKYYPGWRIVPDTIIDLIHDLFIVYNGKTEINSENEKLMNTFERLFNSKFYIQNDRILIQEKGKRYGIERTASGLKSLSWFYLILRYNLLGEIIFIDEPEVNLHPIYIDKLAYFLFKMSKNRQVFISTHSDYLLESFNKFINKYDFKVDVWEGRLENNGGIYNYYETDRDNLIDTSPLNDTYTEIIKELFEYEGEIEF